MLHVHYSCVKVEKYKKWLMDTKAKSYLYMDFMFYSRDVDAVGLSVGQITLVQVDREGL